MNTKKQSEASEWQRARASELAVGWNLNGQQITVYDLLLRAMQEQREEDAVRCEDGTDSGAFYAAAIRESEA